MIQLVDDQLLGVVLRGGPPPRPQSEVFTTGYWYVRLCRAVLGSSQSTGVLSAPFAALPNEIRDRAIQAVIKLPEPIGLMSLRDLGPVIGNLRNRYDLNVLGIEVLAAAVSLQADVYLSARSPRLEDALRRESRGVEIMSSSN